MRASVLSHCAADDRWELCLRGAIWLRHPCTAAYPPRAGLGQMIAVGVAGQEQRPGRAVDHVDISVVCYLVQSIKQQTGKHHTEYTDEKHRREQTARTSAGKPTLKAELTGGQNHHLVRVQSRALTFNDTPEHRHAPQLDAP